MEIQLQNLTKKFPNRNRKHPGDVIAVNEFNFTIPDGQLIGLLGPSGCGKSTTLNLICGLEKPTSGKIFFGGEDVTGVEPEHRGVGMVFQNYALYPHLTVRKNIMFPLENLKGKDRLSKEEMEKRVLDAAKMVSLEELLDRKPRELSGGQQQRVAIARALVKMPRVLLLDEPLSNLDARLRLQTREEIRRIQRETKITTIFVTHDQEEALSISDLIVEEGYINLDFADVSTIMKGAGYAHLAIGHGSGKDKAKEAANAVIASPLLETSIAGAKRLLINITMSEDILSSDVHNATKMITDKAADNVEFIFGTAFKEDMQDEMTITVIAAGFDEETDDSEEAEEPTAEEAAAPEEPEAQPQPQPQQTQAAANGGKKPADPDDLMAIFEILDRK